MQTTCYGHSAFPPDFAGQAVLIDAFITGDPAFDRPTIAMMPIGNRFTTNPTTAALAVKRFLKFEAVIPCRYGSFPIIEANADKFVAAMKGHETKVLVPEKGKPIRV